jgi:hypothetical protein
LDRESMSSSTIVTWCDSDGPGDMMVSSPPLPPAGCGLPVLLMVSCSSESSLWTASAVCHGEDVVADARHSSGQAEPWDRGGNAGGGLLDGVGMVTSFRQLMD